MKKKELYVCEICGAEYGTESEAIACEEDGHTKIEQIRYEYLTFSRIQLLKIFIFRKKSSTSIGWG